VVRNKQNLRAGIRGVVISNPPRNLKSDGGLAAALLAKDNRTRRAAKVPDDLLKVRMERPHLKGHLAVVGGASSRGRPVRTAHPVELRVRTRFVAPEGVLSQRPVAEKVVQNHSEGMRNEGTEERRIGGVMEHAPIAGSSVPCCESIPVEPDHTHTRGP